MWVSQSLLSCRKQKIHFWNPLSWLEDSRSRIPENVFFVTHVTDKTLYNWGLFEPFNTYWRREEVNTIYSTFNYNYNKNLRKAICNWLQHMFCKILPYCTSGISQSTLSNTLSSTWIFHCKTNDAKPAELVQADSSTSGDQSRASFISSEWAF